jgi:ABC-type transporter Mla MlaB component
MTLDPCPFLRPEKTMSIYSITKRANSDGSITVTLGGSMSIETSGELHKILSESLDESQQVTLELKSIESIDISCMQVICSGCKTAAKMGRGYDCADAMPVRVVSFCNNLGGPQGLPCGQNDNKPCIWYGGIP